MQSTTCVHDAVANTSLPEASLVFHNAISVYATNRVFETDAAGRDCTSGRFCQGGEVTAPWCFLGLENRDPIARIPLEPPILLETTAVWEGRARPIGQVFVVCLPCIGGTQEAKMTSLLDHAAVLDRLTRLLAAVVVLLVLGVGWAGDRALRTIRPTRGAKGTRAVRLAASTIAQSSALRAGSSS
jgi:hypothetical protein